MYKSRVNKQYFVEGLSAMLDELSPEVVLIYGGMPESIFGQFKERTNLYIIPTGFLLKEGGRHNGDRLFR